MVQWLGLGVFTAVAQVQSLVGKLRSPPPKKETEKDCPFTPSLQPSRHEQKQLETWHLALTLPWELLGLKLEEEEFTFVQHFKDISLNPHHNPIRYRGSFKQVCGSFDTLPIRR